MPFSARKRPVPVILPGGPEMKCFTRCRRLQVIELLKMYEVKKIITICPHCFNIFKNEYPDLGGNYEVINYLQFLNRNIEEGETED